MKALLLLALVAAVAGAPKNEPVPISETASQSVLDAALANNLVRASCTQLMTSEPCIQLL